jgi:hypothetical protein
VMPGMNGHKFDRQQKAFFARIAERNELCLCRPVDRTRKTGDLMSEV